MNNSSVYGLEDQPLMDSQVLNGIHEAMRDMRKLPVEQCPPIRVKRLYLMILNLMPALGNA